MRRPIIATMCRAAIVAILFWIACSPAPHDAKPVSERGEKLYTLKGTIVGRDTSENTLSVDHESVPGVMDAMTMMYRVRTPQVSKNLHPGDEINFTIDAARYEILDATPLGR